MISWEEGEEGRKGLSQPVLEQRFGYGLNLRLETLSMPFVLGFELFLQIWILNCSVDRETFFGNAKLQKT